MDHSIMHSLNNTTRQCDGFFISHTREDGVLFGHARMTHRRYDSSRKFGHNGFGIQAIRTVDPIFIIHVVMSTVINNGYSI